MKRTYITGKWEHDIRVFSLRDAGYIVDEEKRTIYNPFKGFVPQDIAYEINHLVGEMEWGYKYIT